MKTYVFPGQGSQFVGMGEDLFDKFPELVREADTILGYSIKELCLNGPIEKLNQTCYTQPAIYIVNAFSYLKKVMEDGKKPDYVCGHSLGEYNALFASGALSFAEGLKLVKERAKLMDQCNGGKMLAIIGLASEQVRKVLEENALDEVDIANYNSPYQIVISGKEEDIIRADEIFEKHSQVKLTAILKTSGAFHSRYMEPARATYEKVVNGCQFKIPEIPVIANIDARPYKMEQMKHHLIYQITHSVLWTDSIRYLMGKDSQMEFEEIGVGKVLTGMIQRIKKEATPIIIEDELMRAQEERAVQIGKSILGSMQFKEDYHLQYAYVAGGMHYGISSKELVCTMARKGLLACLGTNGMAIQEVNQSIAYIKERLDANAPYGLNITYNAQENHIEQLIDICLLNKIHVIEASNFLFVFKDLVRFRAKGLYRDAQGSVQCKNKIILKLTRPEVASNYVVPASDEIRRELLLEGKITQDEYEMLKDVPVASDLCVVADSAGYTDSRSLSTLFPVVDSIRNKAVKEYGYHRPIFLGAAGGIGTPEAAAVAFMLGADFILTGSINQCTKEAGTSEVVKKMLENINIQDVAYVPNENMFELERKIQVLRKSVFFHVRANKLVEIYKANESIDTIDRATRKLVEEKYLKKTMNEIYEMMKIGADARELQQVEKNEKYKLALIVRWYYQYTLQLALTGNLEHRVDYQVFCGPALGAFNQWIRGSKYEQWTARHVDEIAILLMTETEKLLRDRCASILKSMG